ncbi:MAG TPA: hypothetical protein VMB81_09060 [Candidatus Sulfotelmatobacter sp.]|nr:hypothetical protein [Candidatus Sulfotelmatobacter sp.]
MAEVVRTVDGEIDDIRERIASTGDTVVEIHLNGSSGPEKCLAYAEKAKALQNLHEKMQGLLSKSGASHIRDLKVRVEISGIVKNQSASKDIIVTAIKISQ